jgi:hypothetical protein
MLPLQKVQAVGLGSIHIVQTLQAYSIQKMRETMATSTKISKDVKDSLRVQAETCQRGGTMATKNSNYSNMY